LVFSNNLIEPQNNKMEEGGGKQINKQSTETNNKTHVLEGRSTLTLRGGKELPKKKKGFLLR
jgi:hypothetical protein